MFCGDYMIDLVRHESDILRQQTILTLSLRTRYDQTAHSHWYIRLAHGLPFT